MRPQRNEHTHAAGGWLYCKVCNAQPPSREKLVEWQSNVRWAVGTAALHSGYIQETLEDSVAYVPEAERRRASLRGAVRARFEGGPCDHRDKSGRYFDIGNAGYAIALETILLRLLEDSCWNIVTIGNLVELLLADKIANDGLLR